MKRLMIDCDGVLADFVLGFTTLADKLGSGIAPYGTTQQKKWDFDDFPAQVVGQAWQEVKRTNFWATLPRLASGAELLRLGRLTHTDQVYFVTSRPGATAKQQTESWLRENLFAYNPAVIVTDKKGEFAAAVHIDYAIDDKAGNAIYTAYQSPKTQSFLLDQGYNQFDPEVVGKKVRRIETLTQFLDEVSK